MKTHFITAFVTGLIFGLGLLVSGMANPDKVLSFLDLAGAWDPSLALVMLGAIAVGMIAFTFIKGRTESLALVMLGAIAVGMIAFTFIKGRTESLLGEPLRLPSKTALDSRLVLGSLGFGVGWGLAGFCPGPALVALGAGEAKAAVFVAAMLAGMGLFELIESRKPANA